MSKKNFELTEGSLSSALEVLREPSRLTNHFFDPIGPSMTDTCIKSKATVAAQEYPEAPTSFACYVRSCKKTFKTLGGMHRHVAEKHGSAGHDPAELLCPKELCEKGLTGQGFQRRYRLVNHLMSANNNRFPGQGHGITKREAQRIAAEINYLRAQVLGGLLRVFFCGGGCRVSGLEMSLGRAYLVILTGIMMLNSWHFRVSSIGITGPNNTSGPSEVSAFMSKPQCFRGMQ